ncbi:hypothetical protein HYALB_00001735 [Hymenoscyphus albidus]|uniref:CYTH domain-containing protein n=1 Tax=Hymenoscyphus albidus TaxID=595503 RepID=A0A9N9Q2F5_9HELO|nr:hypothetical protein HYALB_00001735 [Hymenoscyphus albidus]
MLTRAGPKSFKSFKSSAFIACCFASARPFASAVEVERKFCPNDHSYQYLAINGYDKKRTRIHDIYYDRYGQLFQLGVYLRRRNGEWEGKISVSGNYIDSVCTEILGADAVKEVIKRNLKISTDGKTIQELLKPCAEFITDRQSWTLADHSTAPTPTLTPTPTFQSKLSVVIDESHSPSPSNPHFKHIVGEVEWTAPLFGAQRGNHLERIGKEKVEAVMRAHPQAFPRCGAGKLTVYFQTLSRRRKVTNFLMHILAKLGRTLRQHVGT